MTRSFTLLALATASLAGCAGNTGFEIEVLPNAGWTVPNDFTSIQVQVTAETQSSSGENDAFEGGDYTVSPAEKPPYVVIVLANGTQYTEAKVISVSLLQADGGTFKQFIANDTPITEGELKQVSVSWSE